MPEIQRIEEPIKVVRSIQVPPTNAQVTRVLVGGIPACVRENVRSVPDPDDSKAPPISENILELLAPLESWTKISTVIALEDDQKRAVHPAPPDFTEEWVWNVMGEPVGGLPSAKAEVPAGTIHDCEQGRADGRFQSIIFDTAGDGCGDFEAKVSKTENGWWLGSSEENGISIKFCPFCGKKLDEA